MQSYQNRLNIWSMISKKQDVSKETEKPSARAVMVFKEESGANRKWLPATYLNRTTLST